MSIWTTIEAEFIGLKKQNIEPWPTGSESGPSTYETNTYVSLSGRMRDFDDYDCPAALGWFVDVCTLYLPKNAELMLNVDIGPKYRWIWNDGKLVKLKGILDQ